MFAHQLRFLFILLLSVYSFINILFTEGDKLFGYEVNGVIFFSIILLLVALIWEGNRAIQKILTFPKWSEKAHPLLIYFALSFVMVLTISVTTAYLLQWYYNDSSHTILTFKLLLGFTFRVNLFLHCVNAIYFFVNRYNQSLILAEKLKKESAEAQFAALRNQVNPHFLFNSFNVLSSLVHTDADTASKFIDQLSTVYRYLLQNQQNKIVSLQEELAFIEAYIFLLKIRFQDNLLIDIDIEGKFKETSIAPAALQLLIENAIKHNVVSKSNPLTIKIYSNSNYLIVENSIMLKEVKEESTYIGLKNLKKRYDYLCGEDAVITNSNGVFKVKIPIINEI